MEFNALTSLAYLFGSSTTFIYAITSFTHLCLVLVSLIWTMLM